MPDTFLPNRLLLLTVELSLVLAIVPAVARADWLPSGTPIAEGAYSLHEWPFTAVPDGKGGAIVSWGERFLHASRITREGDIARGWPADGTVLQQGPHLSFYPLAAGDDRDGAFVVFNALDCEAHCAFDPTELRAQHVSASGAISEGWGTSGLSVGSGFGPDPKHSLDYGNTVVIPDERGGMIVVWSSRVNRDGHGPVELKAQRMDTSGALLWGAAGTLVRSTTRHAFLHAVAPDGEGGAFIFWQDERSPGLFAQHLSRSGTPLWAADGIPVPRSSFTSLSRPVAIADHSRGALVAWVGAIARDSGIFVARVSGGGKSRWREPTRVLDGSAGIDSLRMVPVHGGGAILAWRATRRPAGEAIYAQRIGRDGRTQWRRGGEPVCTAAGHRDYLALAPDERGGAYVAWGDTRPAGELFATHLDDDGEPVRGWDRDGSPICPRIAAVSAVQLVAGADEDAIVLWTDDRRPFGDGFRLLTTQAMSLLRHGAASSPAHEARAPEPARQAAPARLQATAPVFALRGMRPNPGPRGSVVCFSLPDAAPATLDLFDVAGRRVWGREVGSLGAGEHEMRFGNGAWIPAGIYLAQLTQGPRVATARVAIVR